MLPPPPPPSDSDQLPPPPAPREPTPLPVVEEDVVRLDVAVDEHVLGLDVAVEDPRVLEAINRQILWHYLEIDAKGKFKNPPSTDDELHEFIQIAYNANIPRKAIEPGHRAPFEFIADLFFERTRNALAFANRSGGKTFGVAILNHLDLLFKSGCEIASAGAVKAQAKKAYGYLQDFMQMPWFISFCEKFAEVTGRPFVKKEIQEETSYANGSKLEIITGTEKGLRSPHPHKARIDEIDLIEWEILQTALSMAHSSKAKGIVGQNVFTSTRQLQNGSMQRMLDEASNKGIEIYEWNVWEMVERCTRRCFADPEHGDCPVYTFCKGKAHGSAGFFPIEDFIDKVRLIDRERFEVEWLNKRPSREKLVYSMFDNGRHVMTRKKLYEMTRCHHPQITWPRVGGMDFGSSPGHPFVYLKVTQMPTGAWLVFFEYVAEQRLIRDHANAVKRSPFWTRSEPIYADWSAQDRLELKALGVPTKQAHKDVLMGIDHVSSLLRGFPPAEEPMLYVWEDCKHVLSEFGSYRWPTYADGRVDRTGKPMKVDDHCLAPDTLVCTRGHGWVEIQTLDGKDGEILTPVGFRPYNRARQTQSNAEVYEVVLSNGETHLATENHLFLLDSMRYASVADLHPGSRLLKVRHGPESSSRKRDEAGIPWRSLLEVRKVFQQTKEGRGTGVSSSLGVGSEPRGDQAWVSCSSRRRGHFKQQLGQPLLAVAEAALKRAHKRAEAEAVAREHAEQSTTCGLRVARFRGGPGVAQAARQGDVGTKDHNYQDVRSLRNQLRNLLPKQEPLLLCEVQGESITGETVEVSEVRFAGCSPVWCLNVPELHCFLLKSGVVSHNCMDALRYALYSSKTRRGPRYRVRKMTGI